MPMVRKPEEIEKPKKTRELGKVGGTRESALVVRESEKVGELGRQENWRRQENQRR